VLNFQEEPEMATRPDKSKVTVKNRVDALVRAARPRENHFYELLFDYLKLAQEEAGHTVNVVQDMIPFGGRPPRGWGDVRGRTFKKWLEENKWELGEPCTRLLDNSEKARPGEITIAVRLDRSTTLIREELVARFMHRFTYMQDQGYYKPYRENKVQYDALRDYWIWYRADRHAKSNGNKAAYVHIVCKFYNDERKSYPHISAKKKKTPSIGKPRAVTNEAGRAVKHAKAILHNLSRGKFPGVYNDQTRKTWLRREIEAGSNEFDQFSWIARRLIFNRGDVDPAEVTNSLRDQDPYW
jgi:hypothetical protein